MILTKEQISDGEKFLDSLHNNFNVHIKSLLRQRQKYYQAFNDGALPDFSQSQKSLKIKNGKWKILSIPKDILDRRVEITGPPKRKMIINALNSGANVFMADFEDSNSPTKQNCLDGQLNLMDAVRKTIEYKDPNNGKKYELMDQTAVLFVRPRGLHLQEKNYSVGLDQIHACLYDFGLYFFHNYEELLKRGSGPYFYLPKLEHSEEAELWADIFKFSEQYCSLPEGTIKATVLIETVPAVFQMEEILYALKDHSVGLNCGRWDYIFSFIKCFKNKKDFVLPDRAQLDMNSHFMRSYSQLLIDTCHRRGTHAIGGMAAQIPIKNNPEENHIAMQKVRADKLREVQDGHDGTWVAHPALVDVAKEIFDDHMTDSNQIYYKPVLNRSISAKDLLLVPVGECTVKMLKDNINILFQYMSAWIGGNGCVPINYLMEDTATAEISRSQIWQSLKHEVVLDNRVLLNRAYFQQIFNAEVEKYKSVSQYEIIKKLVNDMCISEDLSDFLTLEYYDMLD